MKKLILVAALSAAFAGSAPAQTGNSTGQFHVNLALNYLGGFNDLTNAIEKNGFEVTDVPVGLSIQPYWMVSNQISIGADIGPAILIRGDLSIHVIPIGVFGRYDISPTDSTCPYVRAGARMDFVGGESTLSRGSAGVYGCVGVELNHTGKVRYGAEVGFDTSEVKVVHYYGEEQVRPFKFTAAVFVGF